MPSKYATLSPTPRTDLSYNEAQAGRTSRTKHILSSLLDCSSTASKTRHTAQCYSPPQYSLNHSMADNDPGALNWRLSAHPVTLLTFLTFRIGSLLMYCTSFPVRRLVPSL
jgi:hypothetical protein